MLNAIRDTYRCVSCETEIGNSPFLKSFPIRKSPKSMSADVLRKKISLRWLYKERIWMDRIFVERGWKKDIYSKRVKQHMLRHRYICKTIKRVHIGAQLEIRLQI